jgi:hypothetical protein
MASFIKNFGSRIKNSIKFKDVKISKKPAEVAAQNSEKIEKVPMKTKIVNYFKQIYWDYKEVGKDTIKSIDKNPFKSLGYGIALSTALIAYKTNPNDQDYTDTCRNYLLDLIMCGDTFNKKSEYYLREITKLENLDLIEYKYCVLFSLILTRDYSEAESVYEKQCTALNKPSKYNIFNYINQSLRFLSRIVDIGAFNSWYFLEKNFIDYDVDENEWKPEVLEQKRSKPFSLVE